MYISKASLPKQKFNLILKQFVTSNKYEKHRSQEIARFCYNVLLMINFLLKESGLFRLFLKFFLLILYDHNWLFWPSEPAARAGIWQSSAEIHGNPVSAVCMFRPFKASERSRQLLALQRLTDLTNLVTLHNVGFKINLHNVNFLNEIRIMTSNNSSSISTWAL